jgi:hypothetical protein
MLRPKLSRRQWISVMQLINQLARRRDDTMRACG